MMTHSIFPLDDAAVHLGEILAAAALTFYVRWNAKRATKRADKAEETAKTVAGKLEVSDKQKNEQFESLKSGQDKIHLLVNGAKSDMLLYIVHLTKRLSEKDGNTAADVKAYEDALRDYTEHQKRCVQVGQIEST